MLIIVTDVFINASGLNRHSLFVKHYIGNSELVSDFKCRTNEWI